VLLLVSKFVWLAGVTGWFFIRLPHQRKARKTRVSVSARTPVEVASTVISGTGLGLIPAIYVFTPLFAFADHPHHPAFFVLGALCFALALWLFRLTHKALGKFWSVSLDLKDDHKLVTDGIYSKIRHPMYSAFWLWAIAQAFLLPNWVAGLSGLLCFGWLYFQRVGNEEKMMEAEFGEEYRHYASRTGRVWPKLPV
jgi:protein-S-isoprenylcysteine O-methyltransferase Ste14